MTYRRKPLYRSVNTRTHGVRHGSGSSAGAERHTKAQAQNASSRGSMHSGQQHGRDYTPLFRFLLSRVGQDWDAVHSEAVARLDTPAPIDWIVHRDRAGAPAVVRVGESSYFSALYVDEAGCLAVVDDSVTPTTMTPFCSCCTHTLNGIRLSTPYQDDTDTQTSAASGG